jgi:hypothetical protein
MTQTGALEPRPVLLPWAHEDLNLGPLPCQGSALPLSYAPGVSGLPSIVRRLADRGGARNRTAVRGFADPCLTTRPRRHGRSALVPPIPVAPFRGSPRTASGRRDSNPRPSPWQGDALPTEPRPRPRPSYRSYRPLTPVEPKPTAPRSAGGSSSTGTSLACATGTMTIWAILSPRLTSMGSSGSRLMAMTATSPR